MATIQLKRTRIPSDVGVGLYLKDNGVAVAWTSLEDIHVHAFSVPQNAFAGECQAAPDTSDPTRLNVDYPATNPQYPGVAKLVIVAKYHGRVKSYDVPVISFVKSTEEVTGYQVIDDPEVGVAIQVVDAEDPSVVLEVADVSTSLLDQAIQDAEDAATLANTKAGLANDAAAAANAAKEAADDAAAGANTAKQNANSAAGRANSSATNANNAAAAANAAAADANSAAALANEKAALVQDKLDTADADHARAEQDHTQASVDHTTAGDDHSRAQTDHSTAAADHTQAASDHTTAAGDHTTAAADHTQAASDHTQAASDHTTAAADHTTAGNDHTQAAADHTAAGQDHTRAGEDHTLAAADHTTAGEDHTQAGADHTQAGNDHTQAGTDHTTAAADHTQAESDHTRAESDHQSIADKADVDGYYQQMTVGLAENLVDTKGAGSEQTLTRRTSCGDESIADDGTAVFKEVRGNTLVWNSILQNGNFANGTDNWAIRSGSVGTASVSNNEATISKGSSGGTGVVYANTSFSALTSHKYYISAKVKTNTEGVTASFGFYASGGSTSGNTLIETTSLSYVRLSGIVSPKGDTHKLGVRSGTSQTQNNSATFTDVVCIDLTLMFGSGNEPTTVAEFEALFPELYYAYNAGTLINNKASKYITDGFNQYNPETGKANVLAGNEYQITGTYTGLTLGGVAVTPDANGCFTPTVSGELTVTGGNATDTCVHLTWSGYRNGEYEPYWKRELALNLPTLTGKLNGAGSSVEVFPEGMRATIGTASKYDALEVNEEFSIVKAVKRCGYIADLGAQNWQSNTSSGVTRYYLPIDDAQSRQNNNNFIITIMDYEWKDKYASSDKAIILRSGLFGTDTVLAIHDNSVASVDALKTKLSGVSLVYTLKEASEAEYVLDEPIRAITKIADFGTETIEPQGVDANGVPNTAPFRAIIKYNDDFTRKIATMDKNFTSKETVDALLSCLGGALNGTITKTWDATNNKWTFTFTPNA